MTSARFDVVGESVGRDAGVAFFRRHLLAVPAEHIRTEMDLVG